ncbi:coiled-coil domain-containing protein 171 [Telopea speciosissima]|uniref:coiled-coil domain-containing protein 171 n=1 Tax=Telopea speciosissima TaxID=54955 RepID=UPI001CC797A2|nr:coiled-coil domain-containing protein 171 [Telopea speciosissima]XP_043717260.1 coiled-coil domain-containing protein 171 [Telopea speciosissima]
MDVKEVSASSLFISEESESLYPMCFGVSCALVALRLLSGPDTDDVQWSEMRDRMLQGSAHLLGLLVWRVQKGEANDCRSVLQCKLEKAEAEVTELKRIRSEDAKANEKVVSIFAAQEQSWLSERKKLQLQIRVLLNELKVLDTKKEEVISSLNEKVKEKELLIQSTDKALEAEESKRKELEEKLQKVEAIVEELRQTANREAQEHSSEIWKHKTAFIELVSNQRQLEAEMSRTLRQIEAAKQELDSAFKQKEESISMVQKLSLEMIKMRKDLEQKDKILSAMLRKSKSDATEKQLLLKEIKISKARRKQAELETERWKAPCKCRHNRHFLRSNLADDAESTSNVFSGSKGAYHVEGSCSEKRRTRLQAVDNRVNPKNVHLGCLEAEHTKEDERFTPPRIVNSTSDGSHLFSPETDEELNRCQALGSWIRSETEKKYTIVHEQRHHLEIDAFAEQMRLKDEKLEAFRWRTLSLELETKRLQSHIEGLDQNMSQLTEENMKLEALLLDRELELKSLKERFSLLLHSFHRQNTNFNSSPMNLALVHEPVWSEVEITKSKLREKEESYPMVLRNTHEVETANDEENLFDQSKDLGFRIQTPEEEIGVEKVADMDLDHTQGECMHLEAHIGNKVASLGHSVVKKDSCPWKMDLHALGVSFKIKRLKQHLLMLEKLAGTHRSCEQRGGDDQGQAQIKGFFSLMTLLNKQVSRYQSLQDKTDDLCQRMHKNKLHGSCGDLSIAKTKEETKTLEHFLEETFQLQRYMVATGQKLMGIQSQIASCFVGIAEELDESAGFDMRRLADGVGILFGEAQRGLEVRIARIIGDLEGTLASDGFMHRRN